MELEEITREQFEAYLKVQKSGVTNMFDLPVVMRLSRLDRETIIGIMQNYEILLRKYPEAITIYEN